MIGAEKEAEVFVVPIVRAVGKVGKLLRTIAGTGPCTEARSRKKMRRRTELRTFS